MKKPPLPVYRKKLFAVRQVLRTERGAPFDVRYAADNDTAIPFLYAERDLDPGQLDHGIEDYVKVEVTIRPLRAKSLPPALPLCKVPRRRRASGASA